MNLEKKGYRYTDKNNSSKSRKTTWHTRLSFPKYRGNFEPPRENSVAARKRKGALPFGKRRAAGVVSRRERVENAPGKFSHLSAIPIPVNIKRALGATKPNAGASKPKISVPVLAVFGLPPYAARKRGRKPFKASSALRSAVSAS